MKWMLLLCIGLAAAGAVPGPDHIPGAALAFGCARSTTHADSNDDWALRETVRDHIKFQLVEWPIAMVPADTATIRSVYVDSLCDKAMQTIRNYRSDQRTWPYGLRLVRAAHYYFAADTGLPGHVTEFKHERFVLDESLSHVIWPGH